MLRRGVGTAGGGGIITGADRRRPPTDHHQRGHRPGQPACPDRRPDGAGRRGTIRAGGWHGRRWPNRPSWSTCSCCAGTCWAVSRTTNAPRSWPSSWCATRRTTVRPGWPGPGRGPPSTVSPRPSPTSTPRDDAARTGPRWTAERAAILQAVGCYAEARVLRRDAAERRPDFATLGALAVLEAEHGEGRGGGAPVHRGAATLPRGLAVPGRRARLPARPDVARRARPPRGPCLVRRRRGAGCRPTPRRSVTSPRSTRPWAPGTPPSTACARSRCPATTPSTRPASPACSATRASPQEAEHWRISAAARYDELVLRHPEAFVDHAADFWLTVGGDRRKGAPAGFGTHISRATRHTGRSPPRHNKRLMAC